MKFESSDDKDNTWDLIFFIALTGPYPDTKCIRWALLHQCNIAGRKILRLQSQAGRRIHPWQPPHPPSSLPPSGDISKQWAQKKNAVCVWTVPELLKRRYTSMYAFKSLNILVHTSAWCNSRFSIKGRYKYVPIRTASDMYHSSKSSSEVGTPSLYEWVHISMY